MAFSRYQSCIRIHGQPILPPLLTDERRKEMQKYKDLAIEVETKLNRAKDRQRQNVSQTSDSEDCNEKVLNLLDDTFEQHNQIWRNQSFDERDLISFDDDDDNDSTTNHVNTDVNATMEPNNNTDKENVITRQKTRKKKSYFLRKMPTRRSKKGMNFDKTNEFEELALKGNLDEMLQKLQEIQLNQMLELNQKQQKEQKNLLKTFENDQIRLFKKLEKSLPDSNKVETTDTCTSSATTTVVQTPNFHLNASLSNQTLYLTTNSSFEDDVGAPVCENFSSSIGNAASISEYDKPVSPERFYLDESTKLRKHDKQIWAANIINACARGFLVRRLMRTNKVENIIKTLKDSLGCLRDLYCDDSSNLKQSDLLLSGRLMQQIEAACYSFYKIFFEISTSERLDIIRLDREIIREKQFKRMSKSLLENRPASSSTTTSRRSLRTRKPALSDTCLTKNRTPVFKTYSTSQN